MWDVQHQVRQVRVKARLSERLHQSESVWASALSVQQRQKT